MAVMTETHNEPVITVRPEIRVDAEAELEPAAAEPVFRLSQFSC